MADAAFGVDMTFKTVRNAGFIEFDGTDGDNDSPRRIAEGFEVEHDAGISRHDVSGLGLGEWDSVNDLDGFQL